LHNTIINAFQKLISATGYGSIENRKTLLFLNKRDLSHSDIELYYMIHNVIVVQGEGFSPFTQEAQKNLKLILQSQKPLFLISSGNFLIKDAHLVRGSTHAVL